MPSFAVTLFLAQAVVAQPPVDNVAPESRPGTTQETAIVVSSVSQEYAYIRKIGAIPERQSLIVAKDGRAFDKIEVKDVNRRYVLWFNISKFYGKGF